MRGRKMIVLFVVLIIIGVGVLLSMNYYKKDTAAALTVAGEKTEEPKGEKEAVKKVRGAIVYQVPGMEKVKVMKDIVYKVDKDIQQKLDVYYPLKENSGNKPYPVILIHGSTSDKSFKDRAYFESWGRVVAASGYAAITFNWRYGVVPEDISDLLVYVREHTEELGIDSKGISVIALSAGVENGVKQTLSADTGLIDSILAYYGRLPLSVVENKSESKLPPIFIVRAGLDKSFAPDCNKEFITKAAELGCNITEVVHEEGVHGFDLYTDNDRSREIIKESLAFIEANRDK